MILYETTYEKIRFNKKKNTIWCSYLFSDLENRLNSRTGRKNGL